VYDPAVQHFLFGAEDLRGHFTIAGSNGAPITKAQVEESMLPAKDRKRRLSFKLEKAAWFYLFRKSS